MIKKNISLIIGLIIGIMVSSVGVYAVNTLNASSISIDKTNMNKVPESNLQSALDYLYSKSKTNNMITIESGVLHETQTYLGVAYLDPTDLTKKCTSQNSVSTTGTKTGCMKWYIYKDLGDSYKMILDHNTTATIQWNTTGINVEFKANNNNLAYDELQKLVSESSWVVTPDLIEAAEVAEITGYSNFNSGTSGWFCFDTNQQDNLTPNCAKAQGASNYAFLFDNLGWSDYTCISSGCNYTDTTNSTGYWTKTTYDTSEAGAGVFRVTWGGNLYYCTAERDSNGLRPVITISKSILS